MTDSELQFIDVADNRIAVLTTDGRGPSVIWLGGFRSDMRGTKAERLAEWGGQWNRAVIRFDYSGHGESGGRFEDGTISLWAREARAVIDTFGGHDPVLVGSSMGGWIALMIAKAMAEEGRPVSGLVLIAPAVDFTERLIWPELSESAQHEIMEHGQWLRPSEYSEEPYPITRVLIEDGRDNLLFDRPLRVGAPVRILQGMKDPDVPWSHAMTLVEHLAEDDVTVTLVKDGDHRLSRDEDIERLLEAVETIVPSA
ncbi:alpha/beta hydrolase [Agaricicola taiwanensis]|uniref:alpha/beta hydrolase n=1 Tax=Agaricicola taiwanensis TaxID=591372 RepID=UPI001E5E61FE|nr:alpha/beta hydrolase [Agaricicola taiwanensis]